MAQLSIWETPEDYAGFDPVGHIGIAAKHRDSDALARSNYTIASQRMAKAAGLDEVPFSGGYDDEDLPPVYAWRASHWAVGWVEYLMCRPDAPQAVLDEAQAIADALEDYPALDEDHWSDLEYYEATEFWEGCSVRHRAEMIRDSRSDASLFAARRPELPREDNGALYDYLRSCC